MAHVLHAAPSGIDLGNIANRTTRLTEGVSVYPDHGLNEHVLLDNADRAMYRAKKSGRNQYQVFKADIDHTSIKPSHPKC
ncbi:diguanylate cyclase domain-containing protein [Vreelandella andesensis]|uniref:diguanylate cyclase domain-containing protein n=1 Tax=Vreelandella andesensis TaxID=447567 RepID=UPI003BF5ADE0